MTDSWQAPTPHGPIDATVAIPGSKSITNRAYILAALADGPSTLVGALHSRDTDLMAAALRSLGVEITEAKDEGVITVTPGPLQPGTTVDCGLAGTIMRFLPGVATLASGDVAFDGDPQARTRPLAPMLDALRSLGADITGDALPFTVHGHGEITGGEVTIDASGSSQFVSGLLLAGARFTHGVTVIHEGGRLPSLPHVEMTLAMLREAGVATESAASRWTVNPGPIAAREWIIEPDLSNATPFMAAAAATGGEVRIPHWPATTTQPGDQFRGILQRMGCDVELTAGTLTVRGIDKLSGINLDMGDIGELTPTVAALAALATTPSVLTGIAHLRGHETDRLAALSAEINALGGNCSELPDGLAITPAPMHGGTWHAYADHRMATAGAIIGLRVPGISVDDISTTSKTLPGFASMWETALHG